MQIPLCRSWTERWVPGLHSKFNRQNLSLIAFIQGDGGWIFSNSNLLQRKYSSGIAREWILRLRPLKRFNRKMPLFALFCFIFLLGILIQNSHNDFSQWPLLSFCNLAEYSHKITWKPHRHHFLFAVGILSSWYIIFVLFHISYCIGSY